MIGLNDMDQKVCDQDAEKKKGIAKYHGQSRGRKLISLKVTKFFLINSDVKNKQILSS